MSWRRLGFFFTCGCVGSVLQAEVCYNIFIYTLTIHTGPSTSDSRPTFFYITSTTHWPIITRSARWRSPASWDVAAAPLSGPVNQCYAASHRRCCRSALRCHYFPSMPLTIDIFLQFTQNELQKKLHRLRWRVIRWFKIIQGHRNFTNRKSICDLLFIFCCSCVPVF